MALVKSAWGEDVYSGHLFAFVSRRGDRIKVLTWSRGGFVLLYKRVRPDDRSRRPSRAGQHCAGTGHGEQLLAIHYDKTATGYLAFLYVASMLLWLR
ncbi:transposase [Myxococcus fulvus]|nr:transposase [Myxococcus fulvus]